MRMDPKINSSRLYESSRMRQNYVLDYHLQTGKNAYRIGSNACKSALIIMEIILKNNKSIFRTEEVFIVETNSC